MLQETYNQEIKEFSSGHIRLKNRIERNSRNIDSLRPDDLAAMSSMSFYYLHWYDTSLKYLNASIDMLYSLEKEKHDNIPKKLEKELLKMMKHFPSYHNQIFSKKSNIFGPDWKVYPYAVNTGKQTYFLEITINF